MKTEKIILVIIGGITVLALFGVLFLSASEQKAANKPNVTSKVLVKNTSSDLGRMKVADEKSADFVIENNGTLQEFYKALAGLKID